MQHCTTPYCTTKTVQISGLLAQSTFPGTGLAFRSHSINSYRNGKPCALHKRIIDAHQEEEEKLVEKLTKFPKYRPLEDRHMTVIGRKYMCTEASLLSTEYNTLLTVSVSLHFTGDRQSGPEGNQILHCTVLQYTALYSTILSWTALYYKIMLYVYY